MTDEYNGWANRETWAAHLHLSNDEGLYLATVALVASADRDVREFYAEFPDDMPAIAETNLGAERVEEFVRELIEEHPHHPPIRMMADEIGSLWRVDWHAVADAFREEDE